MRHRAVTMLMIAALLGAVAAPAAEARMGGSVPEFERYLKSIKGGNFKRVPDESHPGLLYAGRVGGFSTILRVHAEDGKIVRQRIEVALAADQRDDYALAILSRFLGEFTGRPDELRSLNDQLRAMRGGIVGSGRRSMSSTYRGASITLSLGASPNESHSHSTRGSWGLLFWSAEAERLAKPRAH